jgi:chromosomal replication initiation ATPase DnaA
VTGEQILAHVASAFDVTVAELRGRDRSRNLILARQAAYVVLHQRRVVPTGCQRSYAQIGRLLNRKVWAVRTGIEQAYAHARCEPAYAQTLTSLIAM